MNRVTLIILGVAVAIAVAFLLGGPLQSIHRKAELEARGAMIGAIRDAGTATDLCELDVKIARGAPTPEHKATAKAGCEKAQAEIARIPAITDAYRKACRSCASDERCEDEIATIRRLGLRVGTKSACDD